MINASNGWPSALQVLHSLKLPFFLRPYKDFFKKLQSCTCNLLESWNASGGGTMDKGEEIFR